MERYLLKLRHICLLSALLAVGGAVTLGSYFGQSSWDVLFDDVEVDVVPISEVRMVAEFPVTDATITSVLSNDDIFSKSFPISVAFQGANGRAEALFRDQSVAGLRNSGIELPSDLAGKRFVFYVDLPKSAYVELDRPFVFFYGLWSPYIMYANGLPIKFSGGRTVYSSISQIPSVLLNGEKIRLVWVVTNNFRDRILGINGQHGLSLRSEQATARSLSRLPVQAQFPRIAASIAFLAFGIIAFSFAATARGYLDIWAFGAFCTTMALFVWSQTPMFYEGFLKSGSVLAAIKAVVASSSILSATILTLAYFRLEGRHWRFSSFRRPSIDKMLTILVHPFRLVLIATFVCCAAVVASFWPMTTTLELPYAMAAINTRLSYILAASQLVAFFLGFRALIQTRTRFLREGLHAQAKMLNRRFVLAIIFAISMSMMLAVYLTGLGSISLESGTDVILIAAIFPALAMLLMFFWMVASAQRFYARFSPRLGQVDQEVMAFGAAALDKRYNAALIVFDMAGMKRLNEIRVLSPAFEQVVDKLLSHVEHDLGVLVQRGRITFRYKSNGDEFIFAMWAKDADDAKRQFVELITAWQDKGKELMSQWRQYTHTELAKLSSDAVPLAGLEDVVNSLDMHVLACTMNDVKISVKGGIETPTAAPDFIDARFTRLSTLFKPSRWDKIAVFADDAQLLASKSGAFAPSEADASMGFWSIDVSPSQDAKSAA